MDDAELDGAGLLEGAVLRSVKAAGIDKDGKHYAAVEMAVTYARQIDRVPVDAGQERTKVLYLGPHFMNALSVLGLTPKGEAEIKKILEQAKVEAQRARVLKKTAAEKTPAPAPAAAPVGAPGPGVRPGSITQLDAIRQNRGGGSGNAAG